MSSFAPIAILALLAVAAREFALAHSANVDTARRQIRMIGAYATAGDEWLTAVAREAHAARAARAA